jgi:undecaprenyl pyrophosphate synthase
MIHLSIIPDGNRRFAEEKNQPIFWGHLMGIVKIHEFINWIVENDEIEMVSVYALSSENLKRDEGEKEKLWDFYRDEFIKLKTDPKIVNNKIRIRIVGDESLWREDVKKAAHELMEATSKFSNKTFNILLVYSAEDEMKKAFGPDSGDLMVKRSVDLLIRTGGEKRMSGMLPLQSSYAEIYFSDTFFPAFTKEEFQKILKWFSKRDRRFGR